MGMYSEWLPVASGVPQGTIWVRFCLFYILMILDMLLSIHLSNFLLTISLYYQISCYDDCLKLQIDLTHVYEWSLKWHPKLNPRKCEAVKLTSVISGLPSLLSTPLDPIEFRGPRR